MYEEASELTPVEMYSTNIPDFRISYRISGFRTPKRLCRLRAPFSCLEGLLDLFWEFRRPNCSAMCKAKLRKHTFIRFGGVEMSQFGKRQLQKPSSPSAAAFSARSSSFRASSTSLLDAHLPPICLNQFLFFSGMSSMNLFLPFA